MKLPENPNIDWLKKFMSELNINSDRVIRDMCYKEFFNAYPDYIELAKKIIEESNGSKSIYAFNMYKCGVVDIEWLKNIINIDTDTKENNMLYILNKIKDKDEDLHTKYEEISKTKTEKQLNMIMIEKLGGV